MKAHLPSATGFTHQALRTRVIAKPGVMAELGRELTRLGCQRLFLLSGQRTAAGPVWADVRLALGELPFLAVQDIEPHSSLATVERVAELTRTHGADAQVTVGDGSVSDTAKAVALVLAEGTPLTQQASRFVPPATVLTPDLVQVKLPILSIAMTASGAMATPSLGIRTRLRDLGIPQDQLADIAEKTLHEHGLAYNPRSVQNAQELEAILLAAW